MIPEVHVSVRIALFQVFAVILGVFMTRAAFMGAGYPDALLDWNSMALLIRNQGFILLLVPVMWTIAATYCEHYSIGWWSRRWTIITGMLVLGALTILLVWSYSNPFHYHKMPLIPYD